MLFYFVISGVFVLCIVRMSRGSLSKSTCLDFDKLTKLFMAAIYSLCILGNALFAIFSLHSYCRYFYSHRLCEYFYLT